MITNKILRRIALNFIQTLALVGILFSGSLAAMSIPPKTYYSKANLTAIDDLDQRRHAAMRILIDEHGTETVDTENPAITSQLTLGLIDVSFPILVSASLLKNLLIRTYRDGVQAQTRAQLFFKIARSKVRFVSSLWDLYDIPQSQFVLLMPKEFSNLFPGKSLGLKQLPSLNKLIPENIEESKSIADNPYKELVNWLEQNKKIIPFSSKDLGKIFVTNSDNTPIWDLFIIGHGDLQPPLIAGLSPAVFNSMLSFFDNKIKAGIIYVSSCFSGGKNRTLLETTQDGVQINHNFILILGSIGDLIVADDAVSLYTMVNTFFNNAALVQDKGGGVNNVLKQLVSFYPSENDPHGIATLPQIWFPGGYGFQTPNILDGVFSLGNVLLKKHKENGQPIIIQNKIAILVYPSAIDVQLNIVPVNMGNLIKKSWKNLLFIYETNFFSNVDILLQKKIINQLKTERVLPNYLSQLPELALVETASNPNYYLYPQFISMVLPEPRHSFSEIRISTKTTTLGNQQIAQGILQFIRDGFFHPTKTTKQHYFIDSLNGINDLSLTLAASRLLSNRQDKHPLEELLKDRINQVITLKNVMLESPDLAISFQIDNTAWRLTLKDFSNDPTKEMRWNFKKIDLKTYEELYKSNKQRLIAAPTAQPSQKSISEILKQKQAQLAQTVKAVATAKPALITSVKESEHEKVKAKLATVAPVAKPVPIKLIPKTKPTAPAKPEPSKPVQLTPTAKPVAAKPVKLIPKVKPVAAAKPESKEIIRFENLGRIKVGQYQALLKKAIDEDNLEQVKELVPPQFAGAYAILTRPSAIQEKSLLEYALEKTDTPTRREIAEFLKSRVQEIEEELRK